MSDVDFYESFLSDLMDDVPDTASFSADGDDDVECGSEKGEAAEVVEGVVIVDTPLDKVRQDLSEGRAPVCEVGEGRFVAYGVRHAAGYARGELTIDLENETMQFVARTHCYVPEDKRRDVRRALIKMNNGLIIEGMGLSDEGEVIFTTVDLPLEGNNASDVVSKGLSTVCNRMEAVTELLCGADPWEVVSRETSKIKNLLGRR